MLFHILSELFFTTLTLKLASAEVSRRIVGGRACAHHCGRRLFKFTVTSRIAASYSLQAGSLYVHFRDSLGVVCPFNLMAFPVIH